MTETEMYFNFLLHVAAADDDLDVDEVEFLQTSLLAVGASDEITQSIMTKIDLVKNNKPLEGFQELVQSLKSSKNPSLVMTLIRDGYMLSASDGEVVAAELSLIKEVFMSFDGATEDLFIGAIKWAKNSLELKVQGEEIYAALTETKG